MRKQKCLTPGCNSTSLIARGLCSAHYQEARRMVRDKETTWEKLEKRGLAKPPRYGRPRGKLYQAVVGSK